MKRSLFQDALLVRGAASEESKVTQEDDALLALGEELLLAGRMWATKRLDEFNLAGDRICEQDGELLPKNMPQELVPAVNYSASAHDNRHMCPAIFVRNSNQLEGGPKGAIHQALRILPEIVIVARNLL